MAIEYTGNCYLCGATLGKVAMKNHLFKIHGGAPEESESRLVKVEGSYNKEYWLYVDIPMEDTLEDIDSFLRNIWLECCGHMSAFFYPRYDEIDMDRELGSFPTGDKFLHHYDFGDTTETVITIMGSIRREKKLKGVRLLARNVPPVFQCSKCGKTADHISTVTYDEFYCEECGKDKIDEGIMLPITNSPRIGVCGYGGENDTFTFDPLPFAKK